MNLEKSTQNLIDAFGRLNGFVAEGGGGRAGAVGCTTGAAAGNEKPECGAGGVRSSGLSMPDSLNAKLVQANSNLNRLSAAWDGFTGRVKAKVLGSDAVTASVDWATDVLTGQRSSQQKTGDRLSELRGYLYAIRSN
nr:hypothetical protein [Escherichia coli]